MQGIFHFARCLAFVALVVRALVPIGWMPDANGLMMCLADTPMHHDGMAMNHDGMDMAMDDAAMTMDDAMDQSGAPHDAPAQHNHHDVCPFCATPHFASMPDLPQLALPAAHAFAAETDRLYAHVISARFTPQSPRGPPLKA
ncbi:MAG TPA: hypothetical protein VFI23_16050 [Rhizomicrobium sp.]|nr:hypothetical protein [Rhizomicrobium sp.]